MPNLLSGGRALAGTTGSNAIFITLPTAQLSLGRTPTTGTGFSLVTGANGQLGFTSTLGDILFERSVIKTNVQNGNLFIKSNGTGTVELLGNIYIDIFNANTGTFNYLNAKVSTITDLTVTGKLTFTTETSTATFLNPVTMANTLNIYGELDAYNTVSLIPNNGIVYIEPTGVGTVVIKPGSTGLIDNMMIGQHIPSNARFVELTATNLTVNNAIINTQTVHFQSVDYQNVNTGTFNYVRVLSTSTDALTVAGGATITNKLYVGTEIYENNKRVLTEVNVLTSDGLVGGGTITANSLTITLTNIGVLENFAGPGISLNRNTGLVTISNTASLQTVTDNGNITTNSIHITNTSSANTSTQGALVVDGNIGVGGDVQISNDVYSNGGSSYYNRLVYTPEVTVSTSVPSNPRIGDFWINPTYGVEFQYVPNGTQTIWVQFIGF